MYILCSMLPDPGLLPVWKGGHNVKHLQGTLQTQTSETETRNVQMLKHKEAQAQPIGRQNIENTTLKDGEELG